MSDRYYYTENYTEQSHAILIDTLQFQSYYNVIFVCRGFAFVGVKSANQAQRATRELHQKKVGAFNIAVRLSQSEQMAAPGWLPLFVSMCRESIN